MEIQAIETDYDGHHFRSRLEAKWACVFDVLGWSWEYEPIDLKGYIPDFVLNFYKPLLVEVKPALIPTDFEQYYPKLLSSGWDGEMLIVGARIFESEAWQGQRAIGSLCDNDRCWSDAEFHYCTECESYSLHHRLMSWHCRKCGKADGDHYLGNPEDGYLDNVWAYASNLVRYINHPRQLQ